MIYILSILIFNCSGAIILKLFTCDFFFLIIFTEAQLMLKKDAENADEYAFDNPAFKSKQHLLPFKLFSNLKFSVKIFFLNKNYLKKNKMPVQKIHKISSYNIMFCFKLSYKIF